ncbi:MAG TPA: hypothetical protein P5332_05300 [Ignavibacteriales bacterium]|nr:hypothetical protein [Ignavibacteriales bacterium]
MLHTGYLIFKSAEKDSEGKYIHYYTLELPNKSVRYGFSTLCYIEYLGIEMYSCHKIICMITWIKVI